MTREEQINKAVEDLLDETEISMEGSPLLRMWYKLGAYFADKNPVDKTDWQQVRIQAAIEVMKSLRLNKGYDPCSYDDIAKYSVRYADALVKELKGE